MSAHASKQAQPRDLPGPITRAAKTISATFYLITTGLLALIGMTLPEDNRGRHAAKTPGGSRAVPRQPVAAPPAATPAGLPPWADAYMPAPVEDWDDRDGDDTLQWLRDVREEPPLEPLDPPPAYVALHAAPDVPRAHTFATGGIIPPEHAQAVIDMLRARPCLSAMVPEPEPPTVTDMPAVADRAFVTDTLASDPNAPLREFVAQAGEFMADFPPAEPWVLEDAS